MCEGGERGEENLISCLDLHLGQKEKLTWSGQQCSVDDRAKKFLTSMCKFIYIFFAIPPPMKLNLGLQIGGRILNRKPTWINNHYD